MADRARLRDGLKASTNRFVVAANEMVKASNRETEVLLKALSDARREVLVVREHERGMEMELASLRVSAGQHDSQVAEAKGALAAVQKERDEAVSKVETGAEAIKRLEAALQSERYQHEAAEAITKSLATVASTCLEQLQQL